MGKKHVAYDRIAAARQMLAATWPQTFKGLKEAKPPLKIGIFREIQRAMPEVSGRLLAATLDDYTGGPSYLRSMTAGADRIDLDGQPAGQVLAEQELTAAQKLVDVLQFRADRTAAQRQANDEVRAGRKARRAAERAEALEKIGHAPAAAVTDETADVTSLAHDPQAHTEATEPPAHQEASLTA